MCGGITAADELSRACIETGDSTGNDILFEQQKRSAGLSGRFQEGVARETAEANDEVGVSLREKLLRRLQGIAIFVPESPGMFPGGARRSEREWGMREVLLFDDLLFDGASAADKQEA